MLTEKQKERWQQFLDDHPLFRVFVLDPRFAVLATILSLVILTAVVMLPKVWRRTPPGFKPVIKISGLDKLQAWSLHRSAVRLEAEGKERAAILAWERAVANDPCDLILARGVLRAVVKGDKLGEFHTSALGQALWLLRLGQTNIADVELTAQVCRVASAPQLLLAVLEPLRDRWTPELRVAWTKSAFDASRWQEVGNEIAKGGFGRDDGELTLYIAAWQSAFGEPAQSGPAKDFLKSRLNDPQWQVLAHRLSLVSVSSRDDLDEYARLLKQLELWKEDRFGDHLRLWQMLFAAGRPADASRLMHAYPRAFESIADLYAVVNLAAQLKEREFGIAVCRRYQPKFESLPSFWMLYATEVMETREPDHMRAVLAEIRSTPGVRDELEGLGYFFEARMEQIQEHFAQADTLFAKAAAVDYRDTNLAARIADELLRLNRPKDAGKMYQRLESSLGNRPEFWVNVMRVADQLKDLDLIYRASEKGYRLKTNDVSMVNYFVAASLLQRTNAAEVDRLTLILISHDPGAVAAQVNRGASLILNNRAAEGLALLRSVDASKLNRAEQSFFRLDLLEALAANQKWSEAKQVAALIDPSVFFPKQTVRLRELQSDLGKN